MKNHMNVKCAENVSAPLRISKLTSGCTPEKNLTAVQPVWGTIPKESIWNYTLMYTMAKNHTLVILVVKVTQVFLDWKHIGRPMHHVVGQMMKKGWLESRKKMLCIHAIIITQVNFVLLLSIIIIEFVLGNFSLCSFCLPRSTFKPKMSPWIF